MNISTIELTKITASEGMVLTNGESYSDVGGDVYLGKNDSIENWHEIPKEEYDKIMAEREAENELL